jgi:hypothetical protein
MKMRRISYGITVFVAAMLLGCHEQIETEADHIVHSGELATLECGSRTTIPVAIKHEYVHALAQAIGANDQHSVDSIVSARHAITIARGTHVAVQRDSFNERLVRVEEGEWAGSLVWVPFEWLKPVVPPVLPAGRTSRVEREEASF